MDSPARSPLMTSPAMTSGVGFLGSPAGGGWTPLETRAVPLGDGIEKPPKLGDRNAQLDMNLGLGTLIDGPGLVLNTVPVRVEPFLGLCLVLVGGLLGHDGRWGGPPSPNGQSRLEGCLWGLPRCQHFVSLP